MLSSSCLRLFLFPFQYGATAEYQVLALGVHFRDHAQQLLLEKLGVILHAKHSDLARRNETAKAAHLALQTARVRPGDTGFRHRSFHQVGPVFYMRRRPGNEQLIQAIVRMIASHDDFQFSAQHGWLGELANDATPSWRPPNEKNTLSP